MVKTKRQIEERIKWLRMRKDRLRKAEDRREITTEILALQWVIR